MAEKIKRTITTTTVKGKVVDLSTNEIKDFEDTLQGNYNIDDARKIYNKKNTDKTIFNPMEVNKESFIYEMDTELFIEHATKTSEEVKPVTRNRKKSTKEVDNEEKNK